MAKLKAAVRTIGDHKQRITVNVSIEGIKIIDEKTEVCFIRDCTHLDWLCCVHILGYLGDCGWCTFDPLCLRDLLHLCLHTFTHFIYWLDVSEAFFTSSCCFTITCFLFHNRLLLLTVQCFDVVGWVTGSVTQGVELPPNMLQLTTPSAHFWLM